MGPPAAVAEEHPVLVDVGLGPNPLVENGAEGEQAANEALPLVEVLEGSTTDSE